MPGLSRPDTHSISPFGPMEERNLSLCAGQDRLRDFEQPGHDKDEKARSSHRWCVFPPSLSPEKRIGSRSLADEFEEWSGTGRAYA